MKKIALTQGKYALVDDDDYEWLITHRWQYRKSKSRNIGYASRGCKGKTIRMHREILRACDGEQVDHKNRDGLDNQKSNLRLCTNSQNNMNRVTAYGSSILKGVCWDQKTSRWRAQITAEGKRITLGRFENEVDAALTYDQAARKYYGEFARPNFKEGEAHGIHVETSS